MIEIALRFDDPSAVSDHALERGVLNVLDRLGIPATFAVVPFGQGPEGPLAVDAGNAPHLVVAQTAGQIEVAQHGQTHESIAITAKGVNSEFQGVACAEQRQRLDTGRAVLEAAFGGPILGFVPPWNSYDATTTALLAERGYRYISAGLDYPRRPRMNLRVIPHTCDIHHLQAAVSNAARRFPADHTIVCIQHHYDFQESQDQPGRLALTQYRDLLERLSSRLDVRFSTLANLANKLSIETSWAAQARNRFKGRLHWRLQRHIADYQLYTKPIWAYLR